MYPVPVKPKFHYADFATKSADFVDFVANFPRAL